MTTAGLFGYVSQTGVTLPGVAGTLAVGTNTFSINANTGALYVIGPLVSGGDISGATVTGGVVQSTDLVNRGVKINNSGLVAYDANGVQTFTIVGSTGSVEMTGALKSGSTITGATITGGTIQTGTSTVGNRMVMMNDASGGVLAGYLGNTVTNGFSESSPGFVNPSWDTANLSPSLRISSPRVNGYAAATLLMHGAANVAAKADFNCKLTSNALEVFGLIQTTQSVNATGAVVAGGGLKATAGGLDVTGLTTLRNSLDVPAAGGISTSGPMTAGANIVTNAEVRGGEVYATGLPTATGGVAVQMGSGGRIFRTSTSSRRFKQSIREPKKSAAEFLTVVPYSHRYREGAGDIDTTLTFHAFMAEDLDESGFSEFVAYNKDGLPEGVDYMKWVVPLQVIVRDLNARLLAAEAALAARP
jgi:hypothetical protein